MSDDRIWGEADDNGVLEDRVHKDAGPARPAQTVRAPDPRCDECSRLRVNVARMDAQAYRARAAVKHLRDVLEEVEVFVGPENVNELAAIRYAMLDADGVATDGSDPQCAECARLRIEAERAATEATVASVEAERLRQRVDALTADLAHTDAELANVTARLRHASHDRDLLNAEMRRQMTDDETKRWELHACRSVIRALIGADGLTGGLGDLTMPDGTPLVDAVRAALGEGKT